MYSILKFLAVSAALLLCAIGIIIAACSTGGSRRGQVSGGFDPNHQFGDGQPGQPRPTVKVALRLPLSGSGSAANIAKALKQAGELALFDLDNPRLP